MWAALTVWAFVSTAGAAGPPPELCLDHLSGLVQFATDEGFRDLARGVILPIPVPPGARVDVLRGTAVFSTARIRFEARPGQAFRFRLIKVGGEPRGFELEALGPRTTLVVDIDRSSLMIYEGDAVSFVDAADGSLEIQSRSGFVSLTGPESYRILSPGEVAMLPRGTAPPLPDEAPIVEPGEELRSAVGPKPTARPLSGGCRFP